MATLTTTTTVVQPTGTTKPKRRGSKKPLALPPYSLIARTTNGETNTTPTADDVLEAVANLLEGRKNIVVLVGAGISTSVGIPDFRSKDKGLYNTLDAEALGLSCPEDLFCIEFFRSNPVPFYKFARHLYYPNRKKEPTNTKKSPKKPSKKPPPAAKPTRSSQRIGTRQTFAAAAAARQPKNAKAKSNGSQGTASPSDSHKLLALLERRKMLLRVYTQNIDGLEALAGVSDSKIVYCHGSLRTVKCTQCSKKNLPLDAEIMAAIERGAVPLCRAPVAPKSKPKVSSTKMAASPPQPIRISKRQKRSRSVMEGDGGDHRSSGFHHEPHPQSLHNSSSFKTLDNGQPCCGGVLKPGITFFGETLDHSVGRKIESDRSKADALIVIGTSLSVAPISKVIEYLPPNIPRILINRTIVHPRAAVDGEGDFRSDYVFDAYLMGFCDDVTRALGKQLGLGSSVETTTTKAKDGKPKTKAKKRSKAMLEAAKQKQKHASDTGARLLKDCHPNNNSGVEDDEEEEEDNDDGWMDIAVPRERVLLFPGALPANDGSGTASGDAAALECYREVANCDGCRTQIPTGKTIFKCAVCFDYDLCQSCYPRISKTHCGGSHSFRRE